MKKTLGALALIGASALVLAGCAAGDAGSSSEETEGAEIRVWLNGTDTPQEARDYLKKTFEDENPGSTLVIEEQTWEGLVDKLTTSLSSSDSPDIVEFGNTQAPAFTSVGALLDLTDMYDALGGDDLLPGFVEAGSYEDAFYAPPLYAGARVVFADPAHRCGGSRRPRRVHRVGQGARGREPRQVGHLLRRPGLVQRSPLHLGERWRGRRCRRRHLGRAAELARVGQGSSAGSGPHGRTPRSHRRTATTRSRGPPTARVPPSSSRRPTGLWASRARVRPRTRRLRPSSMPSPA